MYFTGVDLHKRSCFVTTIDEQGRVIKKANLASFATEILGFLNHCVCEELFRQIEPLTQEIPALAKQDPVANCS